MFVGEKINIYFASALFNGRETSFNLELVDRLENKGNKVLFPQRDGFEFGRLSNALEGKMPREFLGGAIQQIIYFLDMGLFLPTSEVVVANLDEPQDEGVMVEMSYAKLMNKFVVGYRTDARSPYGDINDSLGGIHFFPAFQCDYFIKSFLPCRNVDEKKQGLDKLVETINGIIREKVGRGTQNIYDNPKIKKVVDGAELLFGGIEEIHSEKGLEEISKRYIENQNILNDSYPVIIGL